MSVAVEVEAAIARWRADDKWYIDLSNATWRLTRPHSTIFTTGVGKSALVAQKLSASLRAHGVPAHDLDPVTALHGDLGGLRWPYRVVAVSSSGATEELVELGLAIAKRDTADRPLQPFDVGIYGSRECRLVDNQFTGQALPTFATSQDDGYTRFVPSVSFIMACLVVDELALAVARGRRAPGLTATHPGGDLGATQPWEVQSSGGRPSAELTGDSPPTRGPSD